MVQREMSQKSWVTTWLPLGLLLITPFFVDASQADEPVDFQRQVRPILASHCFSCHGPDRESRQADLRLDIREEAIADRGGYATIVPGNPSRSDLMARVSTDDVDLVMPPPEHGERLEPEAVEVLKRWIEQGANYAEHWAFVPPVKPTPPEVKDSSQIENEIDRFIQARLEKIGLTPAPPADRETLIRRVTLDLIGLPPTVEEVDAFLADSSPDAYELWVDHLLESDRFGEHWARMWLDLARYADTKGYEKDQPREMWRYRDWVIEAFNRDLPYDRFTLEQLAGDLLPDATDETRLATAFHRNTMTNDEGGTDDEEFRQTAVKDRVDTTVQVWMGLTMGCAKCHSHKYDPISHEDYYRFYAFFNQTEDADRYDDEPRLSTPTEQQLQQLHQLDLAIDELNDRLSVVTPEAIAAKEIWLNDLKEASPWVVPVTAAATSESGNSLEIRDDFSVLATGEAAERDRYDITLTVPPGTYQSLRLDALTDPSLGRGGPGRNPEDPNFVINSLSIQVRRGETVESVKLREAIADFEQQGWPASGAIDDQESTGWAISPRQGSPHALVVRFESPVILDEDSSWSIAIEQRYGNRLLLGAFRISLGVGDASRQTADVPAIETLAASPAGSLTPEDQAKLDEAFRRQWPPAAELLAERDAKLSERDSLMKAIPRTPILRELPQERRRTTKVHVRGNFLEPGEVVEPGVPEGLGVWPEKAPVDRRGVVAWLFAKDNPLTARVAVNRVWARLFGRGFVETEEDFGLQGSMPTHPELLDWLAVSYRDDFNWSLKELLKTIVMSATYRRSSVASAEVLARDPANLEWARATRLRLPAEAVRDQALSVAGLLSSKIGGPSVMPEQPDGIWQTTYSSLKWETSPGEDRHRRAIYTFLRRTSPYPSLITFDAGSREVCLIRRIATNTPLQALVTLNDPVYVEAAGALGRRMQSAYQEDRERLAYGFRLVTLRHASPGELDRLSSLLNETREDLAATPEEAHELAVAGGFSAEGSDDVVEQAAWTVVGNVLLNLDEVLMRP